MHTAYIGFIVNKAALKGKPIPQSFADLLKPEYKGMVVYDDPTILGTGFTFVYGMNAILKGGPDMNAGFDYLKKLDANILNYAKDTVYNDVLRGEIPIWINADGNGLMINSSRGIIYAGHEEHFAQAARAAADDLRQAINRCR